MIAPPIGQWIRHQQFVKKLKNLHLKYANSVSFFKVKETIFKFDPTFDWSELDDLMHNGVNGTLTIN
jgi:hypothetical protein